jgi:hypothetical protein
MASEVSSAQLLEALPDNAVRMLVESFDASGSITYGASKAGVQYQNYRVTVDYINADTINVPVWLAKAMWNTTRNQSEWINPISSPSADYQVGSEAYSVSRDPPTEKDSPLQPYNIPVYIGIGLRVSANVYVTGVTANISGIGVIGAEAEANHLSGSLIVQTLGVNGKSVAAALPIQSELNRTTAQNAITAVASIKALLYEDETAKAPRVVGLYLPFNGGQPLVNALISALSTKRVQWPRPCLLTTSATNPKGTPAAAAPGSTAATSDTAASSKGRSPPGNAAPKTPSTSGGSNGPTATPMPKAKAPHTPAPGASAPKPAAGTGSKEERSGANK